jgi:hypothetical protein
MNRNRVQRDRQRSQVETSRHHIVYEIFPHTSGLAPVVPCDYFEIALYAEVDQYLPPDHPRSRETYSALMDVAELLIHRLPAHEPSMIGLSASYYTLHPPPSGEWTRAKLLRSVSLAFSNVGPYKSLDELPLFTALRTQLEALQISEFNFNREDEKDATQGRH